MVHQYQLNGYNIVLDTCSGAIHVVDEVAYDIIALYLDHTADEIVTAMMEKYGAREDVTEKDLRDCIDDVEALKQAGKLYTPDTFADMAGTFKERSGDVVKALCLHVAHTCNLNCSYCFASQGKYHGDRALMSFEVGKQALDFLMDHSGSRTNLEVDFFGGEPLMNWDVVKQLVEYARSVEKERGKNFRFTLTTNGMLIDDDVIDFANREMSNVVLSLDGRKEIHDRLRVDYAGNGSYERIVPKFQKLVKARGNKNYYMRGTFTHANPDFTKDLFHMVDLGFTELSMEPVVCAPEDPAALTAEDLEIVKDQYELLAKDMGKSVAEIKAIIASLHEFNPMMGHRGCRLAVTFPEIAAMQTRAVIKAALNVNAAHPDWNIIPEIMIPLVGEVKELKYVKDVVVEVADKLIAEAGSSMKYKVGTMIEIPRAALTADEIAKEADFFSFGTNDLTQMTFGFSRDDAGKFLGAYYDKKIYESDPFARLDQTGVGKLVSMAAKMGRETNPHIHLGICGEHGGDPTSVEFCHKVGLDYVSCSPFRVPIARLAAAQAAIKDMQ